MSRTKDLTDNRYGKLIVVSHAGNGRDRGALWNCLCDCGRKLIVKSKNLIHCITDNCGCSKKSRPVLIDTNSPTYTSYSHMKDRCLNPKTKTYFNYGGRGITVCDRWLVKGGKGFLNFQKDMGERPEGLTLDRINVDGNYCPENCRWSSWDEQSRNKRKSKKNSSGFTGVHWNKDRNKWHVQFKTKDRAYYLGLYENINEAIKMRKFVEFLYQKGELVKETSLSEIRAKLWG